MGLQSVGTLHAAQTYSKSAPRPTCSTSKKSGKSKDGSENVTTRKTRRTRSGLRNVGRTAPPSSSARATRLDVPNTGLLLRFSCSLVAIGDVNV